MSDEETTYATVEVVSRTLTVHGLAPDSDDEVAASKGQSVRINTRKADTLEAEGKVARPGNTTARDALGSDDFQDMRRAASTLGLDVGSTPDKDTLRDALEATL